MGELAQAQGLPGTLKLFIVERQRMQGASTCLTDPQHHTVLVGRPGTVASTYTARWNSTMSLMGRTAHVDPPDPSSGVDAMLCMKHQLPSQMAVYTSVRLYRRSATSVLLKIADTSNCASAREQLVLRALVWSPTQLA